MLQYFQDSFFASFALGWLITNGAGLASYPTDTVRRNDDDVWCGTCLKSRRKREPKSLFKGTGANILRAIAGYDKSQLIVFGKKYGSGGA